MKLSLGKKLWFALFIAFLGAIVFTYFFSHTLYERLYVQSMKKEMNETGKVLAEDYEGGPISEEFVEKVAWFNEKSKFEVFAVKNPRELSMCIPFEIDYDALIGEEERERLLNGEIIQKKGYEERFDRDIVSVIVPLLDKQRLEGIVYLYYPLANLAELTFRYTMYWLIGTGLFLVIALAVGTKWLQYITKPLSEMEDAAKALSSGNVGVRVKVESNDEVGQLAKTFNEMAEAIQKEDEERRAFLANVSHELRTPISYIKGYTEAIHLGMIPEEEKEKYNQIILREVILMERLVGDLLDLTNIDENEFSLQKTPLSLAQTIEDAIDYVKPKAKEKKLNIVTELDYEIIAEVDEGRLEQILFNLLDNAIRYTDTGGRISILLRKTSEDFCAITVKDTGRGIPKEDLSKITQRLYRVNKARTRKEGGTGLGLAIVEKLTRLHGGQLQIDSELGKGTSVTIKLPIINEEKMDVE